MSKLTLPPAVQKYFWGDDLRDIDVARHKKYIAGVLLEKGDRQAVRWLFSTFDKPTLRRLLPELKLDKKSANFWRLYLS